MDEERRDLDGPIPRPADDFVPLLESNDPVMQRLLEKAKRAAASDATILLTGESGTGKCKRRRENPSVKRPDRPVAPE